MLRRQFTFSAIAASTLAFFGLGSPRQYGWILDHPNRHKPNARPEVTNCLTYQTYADALEWLAPSSAVYTIRRVEFLDRPEWRSRRPVFDVVDGPDGKPTAVPRSDITMPPFVISTLTSERHPRCPRVRLV